MDICVALGSITGWLAGSTHLPCEGPNGPCTSTATVSASSAATPLLVIVVQRPKGLQHPAQRLPWQWTGGWVRRRSDCLRGAHTTSADSPAQPTGQAIRVVRHQSFNQSLTSTSVPTASPTPARYSVRCGGARCMIDAIPAAAAAGVVLGPAVDAQAAAAAAAASSLSSPAAGMPGDSLIGARQGRTARKGEVLASQQLGQAAASSSRCKSRWPMPASLPPPCLPVCVIRCIKKGRQSGRMAWLFDRPINRLNQIYRSIDRSIDWSID